MNQCLCHESLTNVCLCCQVHVKSNQKNHTQIALSRHWGSEEADLSKDVGGKGFVHVRVAVNELEEVHPVAMPLHHQLNEIFVLEHVFHLCGRNRDSSVWRRNPTIPCWGTNSWPSDYESGAQSWGCITCHTQNHHNEYLLAFLLIWVQGSYYTVNKS